MLGSLIGKMLASKILATLGKTIFLSLLDSYVESTETTVDDRIRDDVRKALG